MNKVILKGHVGKDPEIRQFDNGGKIAKLTLATNKVWYDKKGEKQQHTEWHNLSIVFESQVKLAEKYITKGQELLIVGELKTRSWEDRSGERKYMTEIQVKEIEFFGSKQSNQTQKSETSYPDNVNKKPDSNLPHVNPLEDEDDDDLPF